VAGEAEEVAPEEAAGVEATNSTTIDLPTEGEENHTVKISKLSKSKIHILYTQSLN